MANQSRREPAGTDCGTARGLSWQRWQPGAQARRAGPPRLPGVAIGVAAIVAMFAACEQKPTQPKSTNKLPTSASSDDAATEVTTATGASLPGAAPFADDLTAALAAALETRGGDYVPRTRHLRTDGTPKYSNRLLLEGSPYLQQHAHNPVNWFPWGEEAFATARRLGRPVLLSIGYSTCHWCHVMEEESFEDEEIAAYLNAHYVAIKVDREERPDLDSVYMNAVVALTGSGGWPMTVWLTPDKKPFHGGTYFPPRAGVRGARIGFREILEELATRYEKSPDSAERTGKQLAAYLVTAAQPVPGELDIDRILATATEKFKSAFDDLHGGLKVGAGGSKFPASFPVRFVMQHGTRVSDKPFVEMALLTLEKMARGGIYDQVGGGFHRYATDQGWLVPHFEKMLYDNALLVPAYLDAWQISENALFARIARETLGYLQSEMSAADGGFYSATDADSMNAENEREEGFFYTWKPAELDHALGERRGAAMAKLLGVTATGNFEGRSVTTLGTDPARNARVAFDRDRAVLRAKRQERAAPLSDDKILAGWNALAISAFARGALVLGDPGYLARAVSGARFVRDQMIVKGTLFRVFHNGRAHTRAVLDDYTFTIAAFLDVFEASADPQWLNEAIALEKTTTSLFADESGAYFFTAHAAEKLLAREIRSDDGALPSGVSVLIRSQLRLAEFTTDDGFRQRAGKAVASVASAITAQPTSHGEMLRALDLMTAPMREIVIVGKSAADLAPLRTTYANAYAPDTVFIATAEPEVVGESASIAKGKLAQGGRATAYVCEGGHCRLPTTATATFSRLLARQSAQDRDKRAHQ